MFFTIKPDLSGHFYFEDLGFYEDNA